jgi:hypothetical protein
MNLTEDLQPARSQLSKLQGRMNTFVTLYEQDDPNAAADVLMKELIAKNVHPTSIATGFLEVVMSR